MPNLKDPKAYYHRTFQVVTKRDWVAPFESRRDSFEKSGIRRGYYFVSNQQLAEKILFPKKDQQFEDYATPFERLYSTLVRSPSAAAEPIVDKNMTVIGHLGWYGADEIFVEKGFDRQDIQASLKKGARIYVGKTNPNTGIFEPYGSGSSDESAQVITNTDGLVSGLTKLVRYGRPVTSDVVQAYDLILIGKVIYNLGRAGAAAIIASLAARNAAKDAATVGVRELTAGAASLMASAARPTGEISAEEMTNYLTDVVEGRPELTRLRNAHALTGEALRRETTGALDQWQYLYGRNVQFVEEGTVQRLTTAGNLMSLQGDRLMIEKQTLQMDATEFFNEVTHELSADALDVRGQNITSAELPFVASRIDPSLGSALSILENSITSGHTIQDVIRVLAP